MCGTGREALAEVSETLTEVSEALLKVSKALSKVAEALPEVWEALPEVREWSESPLRCPGVVGGSSGCAMVVGSPSRMFGCGCEALSDVRE